MVSVTVERALALPRNTSRRAGWLLVAAAVTFIAALVFLFTVGATFYRELSDAADAAGVSINGVPEVERARIASHHAVFFVASGLLFLAPYVILAAALHELAAWLGATRARAAQLARAAVWGGVACCVMWVLYTALELGLLAGPGHLPPLVRDFNAVALPLVTVAASVGAAAVACAALALRGARVAAGMALATLLVIGLFALGALVESIATGKVAEIPQFLPLIPAALLGIGLLRAPAGA